MEILVPSYMSVDLIVDLEHLKSESRLILIANLLIRSISIFQNFNCNNVPAAIESTRLQNVIKILGHKIHGVLARSIKKKISIPEDLIIQLENILIQAQHLFIRYTKLDSLQYVLIGDDLSKRLSDFDESLVDIIGELMSVCQVKHASLSLAKAGDFSEVVKGNIREHVLKAASDVAYLRGFADSCDLEILNLASLEDNLFQPSTPSTPSTTTTPFTASATTTSPPAVPPASVITAPSSSADGYCSIVQEIIFQGLESKYSPPFIALVRDVFEFSESLRLMQRSAQAALTYSAFAVIPQKAVRLFWAQYIPKIEGTTVAEFVAAIATSLSQNSGDPDTVEQLTEALAEALLPPSGFLFQQLYTPGSNDENQTSEASEVIDAVHIAKIVRFIDRDEEDLELVIRQLCRLDETQGARCTILVPPARKLAAKDIAHNAQEAACELIEFVGAGGPVTRGGHYVQRFRVNDLPVFIDESTEHELKELLFGSNVGLVEIFGPAGCGKSTQLLYVLRKYLNVERTSLAAAAAPTQNMEAEQLGACPCALWIDYTGVASVAQAIARTGQQLGLRNLNVGNGVTVFGRHFRGYLKSLPPGALVVFDNIDSSALHLQHIRKLPSKAQPLILFLWSLYDACNDYKRTHRFVFLSQKPLSACPIFHDLSSLLMRQESVRSTVGTNAASSASAAAVKPGQTSGPASAVRNASLMKFAESFPFPKLSPKLVVELATYLCPYDPRSLLLANFAEPGEMITMASLCKINTIRQVAIYVESSAEWEAAMSVAAVEGSALSAEERVVQTFETIGSSSREAIANKFCSYVMSASISDFMTSLSPDEMLLASCISAQLNLFHPVLASPHNHSLSFSTFYPFESAMIWGVTCDEFRNDLVRWSFAFNGLLDSGWIYNQSDLGYMIRDPSWSGRSLWSSILSVEASSSAGGHNQVESLPGTVYYNWAEEFNPPLLLETVDSLWAKYVHHWASFLSTTYEASLYDSAVLDHLTRHFHHIDNALRVFTEEFMCLFDVDPEDEQSDHATSRRASVTNMAATAATILSGKLHLILEQLFSCHDGIEISRYVLKLLDSSSSSAQTSHALNDTLHAELDLVRQLLRRSMITTGAERLDSLCQRHRIQVNPQLTGSSSKGSAVDVKLRGCVVANEDIAHILSLYGKIAKFEGKIEKSDRFFALAVDLWNKKESTENPELNSHSGTPPLTSESLSRLPSNTRASTSTAQVLTDHSLTGTQDAEALPVHSTSSNPDPSSVSKPKSVATPLAAPPASRGSKKQAPVLQDTGPAMPGGCGCIVS